MDMDIERLLKSHGKSVTPERKAIFEGMSGLRLFRVKDLLAMFPNTGRASVFRTVQLFAEMGLLRKLSFGDR